MVHWVQPSYNLKLFFPDFCFRCYSEFRSNSNSAIFKKPERISVDKDKSGLWKLGSWGDISRDWKRSNWSWRPGMRISLLRKCVSTHLPLASKCLLLFISTGSLVHRKSRLGGACVWISWYVERCWNIFRFFWQRWEGMLVVRTVSYVSILANKVRLWEISLFKTFVRLVVEKSLNYSLNYDD